jgi:hypothetical protein
VKGNPGDVCDRLTFMKRNVLLSGGLVAVVLALGACGDPTTSGSPPSSSPSSSPTSSPSSSAPASGPGIAHPTGAGDVVLRVAYEGGFVPAEVAFANLPTLLITGDGTVHEAAAVPAVFPGPLVPPMTTRTLTPAGLQTVLEKAQTLGLLAPPPDYTVEQNVADAPDTVVVLNAAGGSFVHDAYALGLGETELTPARQDLLDFVRAVTDLSTLVGADIGPGGDLVPTAVRLRAGPIERATVPTHVSPTFVDWPADADVALAAATTCAVTAAPDAVAELVAAKQTTYFVENGVTYAVAAAPALPGDAPC